MQREIEKQYQEWSEATLELDGLNKTLAERQAAFDKENASLINLKDQAKRKVAGLATALRETTERDNLPSGMKIREGFQIDVDSEPDVVATLIEDRALIEILARQETMLPLRLDMVALKKIAKQGLLGDSYAEIVTYGTQTTVTLPTLATLIKQQAASKE